MMDVAWTFACMAITLLILRLAAYVSDRKWTIGNGWVCLLGVAALIFIVFASPHSSAAPAHPPVQTKKQ